MAEFRNFFDQRLSNSLLMKNNGSMSHNGPNVLAINVYKVSGAAAPANIILRWGEAQA